MGNAAIFATPDVVQGFNLSSDRLTQVGYITSLTIGNGQQIKADLTVPNFSGGTQSVVCVLSHFDWDGTLTGVLNFNGFVSMDNQATVQTIKHLMAGQTITPVTDFTIQISNYDTRSSQYYTSISFSSLVGQLQRNDGHTHVGGGNGGGQLVLDSHGEQNPAVQSPKNFPFLMSVVPPENGKGTDILVATSATQKFAKHWGP